MVGKRHERPSTERGRGGRFARRLADLAIRPKKEHYRPPPSEACDPPLVFRTYPAGGDNDPHRIVTRLKTYQGKIVEFSIQQETLVGKSWAPVARIDSCRGTVHRHQYDQLASDLMDHDVIMEIPTHDDGDVVGKGYTLAYDLMHDEWEHNLWRWRGDRA